MWNGSIAPEPTRVRRSTSPLRPTMPSPRSSSLTAVRCARPALVRPSIRSVMFLLRIDSIFVIPAGFGHFQFPAGHFLESDGLANQPGVGDFLGGQVVLGPDVGSILGGLGFSLRES